MILGQWHLRSAYFGQARDGAGMAELDGAIYVLGGWGGFAPPSNTTNDFRVSYDGGKTFKQLPTPPFEPRHTFGFTSAWGKLWVIGGDMNSGHYQKDMWSWAPWQGWKLEMAVIPCLAQGRVLFHVFFFKDRIRIVGGQTLDEFITNGPKANRSEGPYYDDCHSFNPADGWRQDSTGNEWAPAGMVQGESVIGDYAFLICGGAYDTQGLPRVYKNTIYRSADCVDWELVSQGVIPRRQYVAVAPLHDELIVLGGNDAGGNVPPDAWAVNVDGVARKLPQVTFSAQHAMSALSYKAEVLSLGGNLTDTSIRAVS